MEAAVIGYGIYQLSEVSIYTRVPPSTLSTWFKPRHDNAGSGPIFQSDYKPRHGEFAVSFLNLIDVYVAQFFRSKGVRPSLIRQAHRKLRNELDTPHPFAHADLCTNGARIIQKNKRGHELTDVVSHQSFFPKMKIYLQPIVYNNTTGIASQWRISDGVVIDPRVRFGAPVVDSTGIPTRLLARQYSANGNNASLVAALFGVKKQAVLSAVRFESSLRVAA